MAVASSTPPDRDEASALQAEQIYITHCAPEDVLALGSGGFAVRAGSTGEPSLLRFAFEYPGYELPLDMWTSTPVPNQTPRRLALVNAPDGRLALIHSVHVEEDTMGRKNSYFTHVLIYGALGPAQALRTWASPDWRLNYARGADKHLPRFAGLPRPAVIGDQALMAFLGERADAPDQNLATLICPARLQTEAKRRRELLRWVLQAALLTLEGGGRERFYVHAEPGLTALLLYGVARLLPPNRLQGFRFSTYEPAHRSLRSFKQGQAVGTYATQKGLEKDYFTSRGYAVDTFGRDEPSPELCRAAPILDVLLDLATQGRWGDLDELHQSCGEGPTLPALGASLETMNASRRIAAGQSHISDVLVLSKSAAGRSVLQQHQVQTWPVIRDASLTSAEVRAIFADTLRQHYEQILEWALRSLEAGSVAEWEARWGLVKHVADNDTRTLHAWLSRTLTRLSGGGTLRAHRAALRFPLLHEWQAVAPAGDLPGAVSELLLPQTPNELGQLLGSGLPDEWLLLALRAALRRPDTVEASVRALRQADTRLLAAYCRKGSAPGIGEDPLDAVLPLLPPGDPGTPAFFHRLIGCGLRLAPATLRKLLQRVGAFDKPWEDHWITGAHLPNLLASVQGQEGSQHLWAHFCGRLDASLIHGHPHMVQLLDRLKEAWALVGAATPPKAAEAIGDWAMLHDLFQGGATASPEDAAALTEVCRRRGVTSKELLRDHFSAVIQREPFSSERLESFHTLFSAFYPPPHGGYYQNHKAVFNTWLSIIKGCQDGKTLAAYQAYYVVRYVPTDPPKLRRDLAVECHKEGRLLRAAYDHIIKATAKVQAPVGPIAVSSPGAGAAEETRRAARNRSLVGALLVVGSIVVLVIVVLVFLRSAEADPTLVAAVGQFRDLVMSTRVSLDKDFQALELRVPPEKRKQWEAKKGEWEPVMLDLKNKLEELKNDQSFPDTAKEITEQIEKAREMKRQAEQLAAPLAAAAPAKVEEPDLEIVLRGRLFNKLRDKGWASQETWPFIVPVLEEQVPTQCGLTISEAKEFSAALVELQNAADRFMPQFPAPHRVTDPPGMSVISDKFVLLLLAIGIEDPPQTPQIERLGRNRDRLCQTLIEVEKLADNLFPDISVFNHRTDVILKRFRELRARLVSSPQPAGGARK